MSQEELAKRNTEPAESNEPPVPQLADVPPEEWNYSTGQAFAGCGVIGAVVLAIILPIVLGIFMDSPWAQIIGFGIPGVLALICVIIIAQMTRNKRIERRATLAQGDEESHTV